MAGSTSLESTRIKDLPARPCTVACSSMVSGRDPHDLSIACLGITHASASFANPKTCKHCLFHVEEDSSKMSVRHCHSQKKTPVSFAFLESSGLPPLFEQLTKGARRPWTRVRETQKTLMWCLPLLQSLRETRTSSLPSAHLSCPCP